MGLAKLCESAVDRDVVSVGGVGYTLAIVDVSSCVKGAPPV